MRDPAGRLGHHETIAELIRENRAPIYLVNFTQRAAAEEVQNLMSVDICSKPEKEAIKAARQWRFQPGTRFGQRTMRGTRIPPSHTVPLR